MLVFDELKKNDPQLRLVAMVLAAGFFILLAGLWWVQLVSAREYQSHLETQAYRTIRIPAMRGKILDCEGRVLAENRARYNLSLYLDDLGKQFAAASDQLIKRARANQKLAIAAQEKKLDRSLTKAERKEFAFTPGQLDQFRAQARAQVASKVVTKLSALMGEPIVLDLKKFETAYERERALPYPLKKDLTDAEIARFEENFTNGLGADLELQSVRSYPLNTTAAHLLGELRQDDSSIGGEDAFFNYRLPDYIGVTGVEGIFDSELHGRAGIESVLVNSQGYRQSEDVGSQPSPGANVVLTIDLDIQHAAEKSIVDHQTANAHAAAIVMDVHNGDILAMVSSPAFDPNDFAQGISTEKYAQIQELTAEKNRATQENYAPGSIFKTVVGLAALENGMDPNEIYTVQPNPNDPAHGAYFFSPRNWKKDTAPPGKYDFQRAFIHSSNSYFMNCGLNEVGIENIIRMGKKFHLGERTGIFPRQETEGDFPTLDQVTSSNWRAGNTANVSIGQGEISVTPIQMAVMISAIANGGTVLWPRLVDHIAPQDASSGETAKTFPSGLVRDRLDVHPRNLQIIRDAMLQDVENPEGSGTPAAVKGLQICGKTGTAQVQDEHNRTIGENYWFASFAPYKNPKYTVIVMVNSTESGSGGKVSGPIAHDIYEAILEKENSRAPRILADAK
jgi:penicillin-binding protein 2